MTVLDQPAAPSEQRPTSISFQLSDDARAEALGQEGGELLAAVTQLIQQHGAAINGGCTAVITLLEEPSDATIREADVVLQKAELWLTQHQDARYRFSVERIADDRPDAN